MCRRAVSRARRSVKEAMWMVGGALTCCPDPHARLKDLPPAAVGAVGCQPWAVGALQDCIG